MLYTILYYTILYYTILYYTILYYTILYYTILYNTMLYYDFGLCVPFGKRPQVRILLATTEAAAGSTFILGGASVVVECLQAPYRKERAYN